MFDSVRRCITGEAFMLPQCMPNNALLSGSIASWSRMVQFQDVIGVGAEVLPRCLLVSPAFSTFPTVSFVNFWGNRLMCVMHNR